MVWKLIFYVHMAGLVEIGEYGDADECAKLAGELNKEFVYSSEYRGWDLTHDSKMRYICAPAPKPGKITYRRP